MRHQYHFGSIGRKLQTQKVWKNHPVDSSNESAEGGEGGPSLTSTGRKEKKKGGKKEKDSGMFSVMAKEMKKALEQRGKNNMAEVALFAETLLKRMSPKAPRGRGATRIWNRKGRIL